MWFFVPINCQQDFEIFQFNHYSSSKLLKNFKGVWVFEIFEERGGSGGRGQIFPIKREFGKIGGGGGGGGFF